MAIYGWDLSHYDSPDSRRAVDEGFSFFTHKAGGDANDAELGPWWNLMKGYRASAMLGAYWVLYPGSPSARADAFLARLDSQCPGWRDGPFVLQADCEKWGGDSGTVPSRSEIEAFCDRLRARLPKLMPIVYGPKWVYGNGLAGLSYPLWASSYVSGSGAASKLYPGDNASGWNSYSGQVPAVLQFTSSATIAGQTTCDANAFRGTLAQLQSMLAPGWAPQEVEDTMSAADAKQGYADALAAMATAANDTTTDDDAWGRQVQANFDKVIDKAMTVGPIATALATQALAIGNLTALLTQQSSASAADVAAALAPLIHLEEGATPDEVEQRLRKVLGSLNDQTVRAVAPVADDDIFTQTQREIAQRRIQDDQG